MKRLLTTLTLLVSLSACQSGGIVNAHESVEKLTDIARLRSIMQELGIQKTALTAMPKDLIHFKEGVTIDLTDTMDNQAVILQAMQEFPNDFAYVCSVDPRDIVWKEKLDQCSADHAVGVKVYLGYSYSHQAPLDSPEFGAFYDQIEKDGLFLNMPVNLTEFSAEFKNVLTLHPNLKVLAPHYALSSKDITALDALMDSAPNLYIDTSFGHVDFAKEGFQTISENHDAYVALFTEHADRILFATDNVVTTYEGKEAEWLSALYQNYIAILKEAEFTSALDPEVKYQGLALSDDILNKVLYKNWNRLLK